MTSGFLQRQARRALPLLLVGVVCLGGVSCASRNGDTFRPAFLEGEQSVIYIFRSPSTFNVSRVNVFVNQEFIGTLLTGEYIAHIVAPGEYLVRVEALSSSVTGINLLDNESAYLQVHAAGVRPTPVIEVRDSEMGVDLLAATRVAPPMVLASEPESAE